LFIFALFAVPAFAVSESAVLFLLISPSTQANGMGETYGNVFDTDPAVSAFNPAGLGLYAQKHFLSTSLNSSRWLPDFDLKYVNFSQTFGYNFGRTKKLPLSIGFGYQFIYLDLGKQYHTLEDSPEPVGVFESNEQAHVLSAAAAWDDYIRASIGLNVKWIQSNLAPLGAGLEKGAGKADVLAMDFGAILQLPFLQMAEKLMHKELCLASCIKPVFTPGVSYSLRNVGDEIKYIDAAQGDPLPRTVQVGAMLETGIAYKSEKIDFNLLSIRCAREAEQMLINRHPDGTFEYITGLRDINFSQNILIGKANHKIITKKGWQFAVGDFIFLGNGQYEDTDGLVLLKTKGFGVNILQPIKILHELKLFTIENRLLRRIFLNLNLEYHYSQYRQGSDLDLGVLNNTTFRAFMLNLTNFPL